MNGYVSRRRLVAVTTCLTVLVVAGVAYSELTSANCERMEEQRILVEEMMSNCDEYDDCQRWWDRQNELTCDIDECWDIVDGVCFLDAA